MKKFNTHRIRQRMREHNEKFPNSKGKLLSSAPIRIPVPTQIDKENVVPVKNSADEMKGGKNICTDDIHAGKIPRLSIAVTMSEDDGESCDGDTFQNQSSRAADDDECNTIPSVWAMMEHYQGALKDSASGEQTLTDDLASVTAESRSNEASDHHTMEVSIGSDNSSGHIEYNEVIDSGEGQGKISETIDDFEASDVITFPSRIDWLENDDGRLINTSFCSQESPSSRKNKTETSNSHFTENSSVNEDDQHVIFRPDSASCISDDAVSPIYVSQSNYLPGGPTPARVRQEWVHSGNDEDVSTHAGSLLEVSMIQSVRMTPNSDSRVTADSPINSATSRTNNDSETHFSVGHPMEMKDTPELESSTSAALVTNNVTKPKLQIQTEGLSEDFIDKFGELESHLKVQQNNTDHMQKRLQERVMELEQALKVTAATPRGTIIEENPLQTLLNRNQTLVKEVRFADQTCVELSSKVSELKTHNERLQNQVVNLEQEKDSMKFNSDDKEKNSSKKKNEREAQIEKLEQELASVTKKLRTKTAEEESLHAMLSRALVDLNVNDDVLGLSLASSIVSERDSISKDHSIDSKSFHISRTVHQQIDVLIERAKSNLQSEEMKKEIHELRAENIGLKSELLVQVSTESMKVDSSIEDSNTVSQLQKENEFLGRQLGIVQEKLDQAQGKLNDECQKSESLQMHLELSAETYKQLIEPLEKRLIEITECDPKLQNIEDVDKRLYCLEKEFISVKAGVAAIKRESERLLTASSHSIGAISDCDQQQHIVNMVQATISRMIQNYKQLEQDVEMMATGFSERLEKLTISISHLRSSLLFEKESVSSVASNGEGESGEEIILNSDSAQYCGSSIDLINATIPLQQDTGHDEDEIMKLMEEARSPRKHEISISSELDDVSRLLSDDVTLGSFVKTGSVFSSMSNMDAFKESLETAVNECKRVRERSTMLKDEIESQKVKIKSLEQENEKMTLHESRRSEEFSLMESALEEAKEELKLLRNTATRGRNDKEISHQIFENEKDYKNTKEENARLSESIVEVQKQREALEMRLNKCMNVFAKTKQQLESFTYSNEEYKKRFHNLQSQLSTKILKVTEQKELESVETRRSLQLALQENSQLKQNNEEILKKLALEVESKLKLESLISELEQSKLQAQSDLEDQDLESKFACEDMRKERAELKHRLSQSEKDMSAFKELHTNIKAKMEEKCRRLEETENQTSELLAKMKLMTEQRTFLIDLLKNVGCCEDLLRVMNSDHRNHSLSPFESTLMEIDCWERIIPWIGKEIDALHRAKSTIPKLELEIEKLENNLSKSEIRESDQLKQAEDQAIQNKKLFDLLRQAEGEMERSTTQIKEMSEALAVMQQREDEGNKKIEVMESEFLKLKNESEKNEREKKEEFVKVKDLLLDTSAALEMKDSQILDMNSQMNTMRSEIDKGQTLLRSKEFEEQSLKANIQSFEKKNTKLREYIRKLTNKCEEWETSYDRQSRAIDRLQDKKNRMKDKACDIAGRYRALVADINRRKKLHQSDREKSIHERSNLNSVHAALEQELEEIAKELA